MPSSSRSYRYHLVFLLSFSQLLAYIDRVNIAVVGPTLVKSGHLTPAALGLVLSIFNWSLTAVYLFAGPVADRFRARLAYPAGVGVWSLATALCGMTSSFAPLAMLRALVGLGEGWMIPSGSQVIRENFTNEQPGRVVGAFFAGNKIGLMLGIPLASTIYVYAGWAGTFLVTGGLGLIWLAWWLAVYRAPVAPTRTDPTAARVRWITLLRFRTTWGIMLGQAGYLYIYYVFANWLPGYLVLQRHMSVQRTGLIGMIPFLVGALCVLLGGWGADRLIARGLSVTLVRKGFSVGGLALATMFSVAAAFASDTTLAVVLLTAAVGAMSLATASINAMPIDVAPKHVVSSLVSLQLFGGNLGGSFAPIVTGLLISASGNFTIPLLVAGGVALVFGCGGCGLVVGQLDHELTADRQSGVRVEALGGR